MIHLSFIYKSDSGEKGNKYPNFAGRHLKMVSMVNAQILNYSQFLGMFNQPVLISLILPLLVFQNRPDKGAIKYVQK